MKTGIWMLFVFAALFPAAAWASPENKGAELQDNLDMRGLDNAGGKGSGIGVDWGDDLLDLSADDEQRNEALKVAAEYVHKYGTNEMMVMLSDPNLTMQDRIALFLILLMNQMDKNIGEQAEKIQKIQSGERIQTADPEARSVDLETAKLKQLTGSREQVFDTLKAVMDKMDRAAQSVLQDLRGGGSGAPAAPPQTSVKSAAGDGSQTKGSFSEVSGLDLEQAPVDYRTGSEDTSGKAPSQNSAPPNVVNKRQ